MLNEPASSTDRERLTPTERRVLTELLAGQSDKQIALRMGKSVFTVKEQVSAVAKKLGVSGRGEVLALALRSNFLHGFAKRNLDIRVGCGQQLSDDEIRSVVGGRHAVSSNDRVLNAGTVGSRNFSHRGNRGSCLQLSAADKFGGNSPL